MASPVPARPLAPDGYPFPDDPEKWLPWSRTVERLEQARNYWLVTASEAGRPHATPVWGVWIDDVLYFDGAPTTRWARNLAANPQLTVHLESGDDVVIIEGTPEDVVTDADVAERILKAWAVKYGQFAPEPASSGLFRIRPRSARAWSQADLTDGTRWTWPSG